jgi:hypothetical protein
MLAQYPHRLPDMERVRERRTADMASRLAALDDERVEIQE